MSTETVGTMDQKTKLILALLQIDNLTSLLEDNEYQVFLYSHLNSLQVEIQRQLTNLSSSATLNK